MSHWELLAAILKGKQSENVHQSGTKSHWGARTYSRCSFHFVHMQPFVDQEKRSPTACLRGFEGYEPNAMSEGSMQTPSDKDLQLALVAPQEEKAEHPEGALALGPQMIFFLVAAGM